MNEEYAMAVWGVTSLAVACVGALACVICMIWQAETLSKVAGTVVVVAVFSFMAALFVPTAIDRASALPTPPQEGGK